MDLEIRKRQNHEGLLCDAKGLGFHPECEEEITDMIYSQAVRSLSFFFSSLLLRPLSLAFKGL